MATFFRNASSRGWKRRQGLAASGLMLAAAVTTASNAHAADDTSAMSLEDLLSLPVETSSKRAQPFVWTPANTIVVTREQITERHYVNLKDVLNDLPGVDIYNNYAPNLKSMVSIRGVPGVNNFVIMQDGQRLSSPTEEELDVEDNYPLFDVERVEILLGPASALYGADAMTGIVNMISRDPTAKYAGGAALTYGNNNHWYGSGTAHGIFLNKLKFDVAGHLQRSDNPNLSKDYPEMKLGPLMNPFTGQPADAARVGGYSNETSSASLLARAAVGDNLRFGYSYRTTSHSTGVGSLPSLTSYDAPLSVNWHMAFLNHQMFVLPELKLESNVQLNMVAMNPESGYDNFFSGYQRTYKSMDAQAITLQEQGTWDINEKHNLVAGVSWTSVHSSPESAPLSAQLKENIPANLQGMTFPGTNLSIPFLELDFQDVGVFAQLQSQWASKISTTIGARYDYDTRFGSIFNPRAGIVVQPSTSHTLKLLYGEGFLAPPPSYAYAMWGSFDGTDSTTGKPTAGYFHVPNPNLEPRRLRTAELTYSGLLTANLLVGANAYFTTVDGIIVPVTTSTPGGESFVGGTVFAAERYQSIGHQKNYGGAVTVTYRGSAGPVKIEPWGNYSLSLGQADSGPGTPRTDLPYNTMHKVKGGVTVRYGKWALTPRVRYLGPTTAGVFKSGSTKEWEQIPGSAIVDVALVGVDIVGKLSVTLDARNLLDSRYYLPASAGAANFVKNPQDTRQMMIQIGYAL